MTEPDDVTRNE